MKNYCIDFTVTLSTCRIIQADSEEEALRIAGELQDNERYMESLIASWDEPYSGWNYPNEPDSLGETGELPEMLPEEYEESYGINPWKE